MDTTIRISTLTHDRLVRLANATGRPIAQLLDEAADALERKLFFEQLNERYDSLSGDPVAWAEVEGERQVEGGAVSDRSL